MQSLAGSVSSRALTRVAGATESAMRMPSFADEDGFRACAGDGQIEIKLPQHVVQTEEREVFLIR